MTLSCYGNFPLADYYVVPQSLLSMLFIKSSISLLVSLAGKEVWHKGSAPPKEDLG